MSRGGLRKKKVVNTRPSTFFIVALTIAVVLLLWGAYKIVRTPLSAPATSSAPRRP